ncbi:F-box only protein 9 isoform X2 [Battus philenor]|uniref:F-box only protein 9 isoform X1 n=1 Tax=Battus philenor TaxID=42288 RepID=UPI0035CFB371
MASTSAEEQEDSSSSLTNELLKARDALEKLSLDNVQITDGDDELAAFRQQWQRELESNPSPQREHSHIDTKLEPEETLSDEEKAKQLFLRGVELERSGKLYEAIQHYKRSMQIIPDVETRLYESSEQRPETPIIEDLKVEEERHVEDVESDEDMIEGEELVPRLQRILAKRGTLCQPEFITRGAHISWLPYEVIQLVLRWAVSADLDAVTLERISGTCRGLYLAAREADIWRSLCIKTWGIECGTPRTHGFTSWRQMYIDRPRIHLHGCYISKTTYLRHGENSYQDQSYRPWYLVDYYRYLRFFPDGVVLMWTTAEEPASCVGQLKFAAVKPSLGIMAGHYRLVGDKVVIVIKRVNSEKKPAQASNTRFRSRRRDTHEQQEHIFHLELELHNVRKRRNWQLTWRYYAVAYRRDQWTQFDLTPGKFPPFAFSRVRGYTAEAYAPLAAHM